MTDNSCAGQSSYFACANIVVLQTSPSVFRRVDKDKCEFDVKKAYNEKYETWI
jgi:hypothetical protein